MTVLDNFFNAQLSGLGLKTAFCNRLSALYKIIKQGSGVSGENIGMEFCLPERKYQSLITSNKVLQQPDLPEKLMKTGSVFILVHEKAQAVSGFGYSQQHFHIGNAGFIVFICH